ncbi:hypothetical protein MMC17_007053 [Xylographa soralifera]|nr:hypothetical protein [Xylographa soralifera]
MPGVKSFRELLGVSPSTASTSDSALVIIDAQQEYASGLLKVSNASSSCAAIKSLLEKYRSATGAIVHIHHETPEGAPVFTPGKEVSETMKGLEAQKGEKVIWKKHPGSYAGTDLQKWLDEKSMKKVVLVGYMVSLPPAKTNVGYEVASKLARFRRAPKYLATDRASRPTYVFQRLRDRRLSWVTMLFLWRMQSGIGTSQGSVATRSPRQVGPDHKIHDSNTVQTVLLELADAFGSVVRSDEIK